MFTIPLLSLAGMVIAVIVGTLWYSEKTPMGRLHMQYLGFDKLSEAEKKKKIAEAMPEMPKVYAAQMALSLLTAFATVFIITMSMQNGLNFGMALGFVLFNWFCFVVPTIGTSILWGNCDRKIALKKLISDSASNLVTILCTALLTSIFVS